MTVHSKGIDERTEWLFSLARTHAEQFSSSESWLSRQRYLAQHPTAVLVLKCMDGRINIPVATDTPTGIIQPFRNLGGMFNLGWPHLGETLARSVEQIVSRGRRALVLITYHYSKGDPHRGCAGFNYDTAAAIAHTRAIKAQVEHTFGAGHQTVYPVLCGFETDEDALILHGENEDTLSLAELSSSELESLPQRLSALFEDMPHQVRDDLVPLLRGNLSHIDRLRRAPPRTLDIQHREWMICIGRGFDFMHTPNLALIIGPYSPDLSDPIRKAASIIESNMREGRVPDDGFLLLASAPYEEHGVDRARATLKSQFMSDFAASVISREFPALAAKMRRHTCVLDWRTRELVAV
jgi:Carboxysome Shell Carbonic Anhydrase